MDWVAADRCWIVPSFAEYCFGIADGRSLHRQLDIVPRRLGSVYRGHFDALRITEMLVVVTTPVAKIYSPDVGNVSFRMIGVPQNDEFLMMRSQWTDTHIQ